MHLVEMITLNLDYPPLIKNDVNSRKVKDDGKQNGRDRFGQAAIPAVLAGLCRLTRTKAGVEQLMENTDSRQWLPMFFNGRQQEVISRVAQYASVSERFAGDQMELIADEAVYSVKEHAGNDSSVEKVRQLITNERDEIPAYLPAELGIGDLLDE